MPETAGPDTVPARRRRKPSKGAAQAERGPKRPIYKRATGPIRFDAEDDGNDEGCAANMQ